MNKLKSCLLFFICAISVCFFSCEEVIDATEILYEYNEMLGYSYSEDRTIFKLYSSKASKVDIYVEDIGTTELQRNSANNNVWETFITGDLKGKEYHYIITIGEVVYDNIVDPYGKCINKEGIKNVICADALEPTESEEMSGRNLAIKDSNKIIYGVNVENFTKHSSWKGLEANRGKLLGLIESEANTYLVGYDYIKSLGVTYLEISQVNDKTAPFAIDNSYVTGTGENDGELELKQVVKEYNLNNIGVIFTFNHKEFSNKLINDLKIIDEESYFNNNGQLDLGKKMTQEYICELLTYYVANYNASGLRIENLNEYSIDFINSIIARLKKINENIIIYGQGISVEENYVGENTIKETDGLKLINGSLSYGLMGNLFNKTEKGFLLGDYSNYNVESLKHAFLSGIDNGEIDYTLVKGIYNKGELQIENSYQIINYIGNKNGLSIYDKMIIDSQISKTLIEQKVILAYAAMMMSGGIPYIYSGEEFLMSYLDIDKDEQSVCDANGNFCYQTLESGKKIDWAKSRSNLNMVNAIKSLINYRKSSQTVAQTNVSALANNVEIYSSDDCPGVIGFIRNFPNAKTRDAEKVVALFNFSNNDYTIEISGEGWEQLYNYNSAQRDGDKLMMKANSLYTEFKEKQPKVSQWITLLLVVSIIGSVYTANIFLNKNLVEKKGYNIKDVKRKYRLFIKTEEIKTENDNKEEITKNEED